MIFISHRQADQSRAVSIHDYFKGFGIRTYLDVVDPVLPSPLEVTQHIVSKINDCSHMIALFSASTQGSMWVPFELGAAYQADKGIATFIYDGYTLGTLPEYLRSFPVLFSRNDLDQFRDMYSNPYMVKSAVAFTESVRRDESSPYAHTFARQLKSKLRQS